MRMSLRADQCTLLTVCGHGTRSFSEEPVRRLRCGGYGPFTASRTKRHVLVVEAGRRRGRGRQPYRLRVAHALRDDTTPARAAQPCAAAQRPDAGRYRAHGTFLGSRNAAPGHHALHLRQGRAAPGPYRCCVRGGT